MSRGMTKKELKAEVERLKLENTQQSCLGICWALMLLVEGLIIGGLLGAFMTTHH